MNSVEVKNLSKNYGKRPNFVCAVDGVSLSIKHGTLIALLGPSGCGKTTLLKIVVGLIGADFGEVRVFGEHPGSERCAVPGPNVGYMPQEISLLDIFTIKEMAHYFGRVNGMKAADIEQSLNNLIEMLELPESNMCIGELSGGQKRSVSFIFSVMHQPKLIILDEPSVGLDPILRENMWNFLERTVETRKSTIIITTHYIEEAIKANEVGIMRQGKLLAIDAPRNIIQNLQVDTLENAFLNLCNKEENYYEQNYPRTAGECSDTQKDLDDSSLAIKSVNIMTKMNMLNIKNFKIFYRHPASFCFIILFPVIIVIGLYAIVGKDPSDIKLGIVDDGGVCLESYDGALSYTCGSQNLSCNFIELISKDKFRKIYYTDIDDAVLDMKRSKLHIVLHFESNFTKYLNDFLVSDSSLEQHLVINNKIVIYLDKSSGIIQGYYSKTFVNIYKKFTENLLAVCNFSQRLLENPMHFEEAIGGSLDDDSRQFIMDGIFVGTLFALPFILNAAILVSNESDELWYRNLTAGITKMHMVASQIIINTFATLMFGLILTITAYSVLDIHIPAGNKIYILFLILLQCIAGQYFGLFVSTFFKVYARIFHVTNYTTYAITIICGVIWPVECQPELLRLFATILPSTSATIAFRVLSYKEINVLSPIVRKAYGVSIVWTIVTITVSFILLRLRN